MIPSCPRLSAVLRALALVILPVLFGCGGGGGGGGTVTPPPPSGQIAPYFSSTPYDQTFAVGETALFGAMVGGLPVPTLQWQQRAANASTWVDIPGSTSDVLSLPVTAAEDAMQVRLVATNSLGTASTSAVLYVRNPWTHGVQFLIPRGYHTATTLRDGRILLVGGLMDMMDADGDYSPTERYDPVTGMTEWFPGPAIKRLHHGAALLQDGRVLVMGGENLGITLDGLSSAEIFDPVGGTWTEAADMPYPEPYVVHALTLQDGRVFVMSSLVGTGHLFNPATGSWSQTRSCANAGRIAAAEVLLKDGRVLVVGGQGPSGATGTAEIYDPALDTWSAAGGPGFSSRDLEATLLADGRVLVSGGLNSDTSSTLASAAIFDPGGGAWTAVGSMNGARDQHRALLLPDGRVLVSGGEERTIALSIPTQEVFDPALGTWTLVQPMALPRLGHTLSLLAGGKVLILGGGGGGLSRDFTETFDPGTNGFAPPLAVEAPVRGNATLTSLADGTVLLAGGGPDSFGELSNQSYTRDSFLFDPGTASWRTTGPLSRNRGSHLAVRLLSGQVMVLGGFDDKGLAVNACERYEPALGTWSVGASLPLSGNYGYWPQFLDFATANAIVLDDGRVLLLASGYQTLYDPGSDSFSPPENRPLQRFAAKIPGNKVLVLGNDGGHSAWIFDATAGIWTSAAPTLDAVPQDAMPAPSGQAISLGNGQVLLVLPQSGSSNTAEVYDPAKDAWTATGPWRLESMGGYIDTLAFYSYLPMPDGTVLGVGLDALIFDPRSSKWIPGPVPNLFRWHPLVVGLKDGRAMLYGGYAGAYVGNPEFYVSTLPQTPP